MTSTHRALYRRWRAQTFGQIVGQSAVVETLRNAVRTGAVAHGFLFVGPRGTGKTSVARILAKAINCPNVRDGEPDDTCPACEAIREGRALDVVEMDAASNNRVDDIRELLPRIYTGPSDMARKVFIVDEVQRIREGWDLLLKTLEEPPDHVVFVFCTTDASQIRPAVISRLQRFDFRRLTTDEIAGKLRRILEADGRSAEDGAIELLARLAAGGMRDAETMLDQLLAGGETLTEDAVRELLGLAESETVDGFAAALLDGDALRAIEILDGLEDRGRDLRAFGEQVIDALRSALVAALSGAPGRPGSLSARAPTLLAAAGRRLAGIDPAKLGPGGIRFQLELAALAPPAGPAPIAPPPTKAVRAAARPPVRGPAETTRPAQPADTAATVANPPEMPPDATPAVGPADGQASSRAGVPAGGGGRPMPAASVPPASDAPPAAAAPEAAAERSDAPPAEPTPGVMPDDALDRLRHDWPRIVAVVSRHPPTKPLIEACRPISVDGNVVTLGFPEGQTFFKDVAERRRPILESGVSEVLGVAVAVRCVATNLELLPPLPADEERDRLMSEARRIFADDLVDVGEVN